MSAFAGIVRFDGGTIGPEIEESAAAAVCALREGRTIARRREAALFNLHLPPHGTRVGDGQLRMLPGGLFAAAARLDNRDELGAALGFSSSELNRISDPDLFGRSYERWGESGVARCLGAFAFAHWDEAARRLTLGRDCLGNRPLFWHRGNGFAAFATSLRGLLALPGVPRELDESALAQFLAVNAWEARQTLYRGIERVPSRTMVRLDVDGAEHRHYWNPQDETPERFNRDEDYIERARELFDAAVAAATRDTEDVAIATSGGLDSSAIAATVARSGGARSITCFCQVPPPGTAIDPGPFHYLDERDKVEALARLHPKLQVRFVSPAGVHPVARDDTRYFARAALPTLNPAGMAGGGYFADAVSAAGHRVILVGNYGNFGLSWAGNLSLVELLRARQLRRLVHEWQCAARESRRGLARTLMAELVLPLAPVRLRRLATRLRGRDPDDFAHYSVLNPDFVAESGLRNRWRRDGFDPWFGLRGGDPRRLRARYMFDYNQYARDLRGLAPEIFGREVRDPHADRRLLEFALSVPERLYRRDGVPRAFARAVFADRLPREILAERRYGAIAPTWFQGLDARRGEIAADVERLESSPLARRLIDLPRLKHLLARWPASADEAEKRRAEYRFALARGVHVGRFIRWVEGGNA